MEIRLLFHYRVDLQPESGGFRLTVQLDQSLHAELVGKTGMGPWNETQMALSNP
jgi:hypothetical protein